MAGGSPTQGERKVKTRLSLSPDHPVGLLLFAGRKINLADLGDAFDDVRYLLAEFLANVDDRHRCVFDGVVQQAGSSRDGVHLHFSEHKSNFEWVDKIRFA